MNPSRVLVLLAVVSWVCTAAVAAPVTYTYRVDPEVSIVQSSGGIGGTMYEQSASGEFRVIIDGQDIWLSNVSVHPFYSFPSYRGVLAENGSFSGSQSICEGFGDNSFSGEIVGDVLYLASIQNPCIVDGFSISFDIEAVLVSSEDGEPLPFGGLGVLVRRVADLLLSPILGFLRFLLGLFGIEL